VFDIGADGRSDRHQSLDAMNSESYLLAKRWPPIDDRLNEPEDAETIRPATDGGDRGLAVSYPGPRR
jgi:hypothetical protein